MQQNLWGIKHQSNWKCCWEEKPTSLLLAWDINLCLSLNFLIQTWLQNQNLRITSQVFSEKSQKNLYNYCIKAQKLPLLKQGVKTINFEFIWTRALCQLFFVQLRPHATLFPGLLTLTLMLKTIKILNTSLELTPPFKTSVDIRVEDLVSNVNYLKNRCRNFIQKKYGRKRHLQRTNLLFSEL